MSPPSTPPITETEHPDDPGVPPRRRAWWESALLIGLVLSLFVHLFLALVTAGLSMRLPVPAGISADHAMQLASLDQRPLTELPAMALPEAETAVQPTPQEREFTIEDLSSPFPADQSIEAGLVRLDRLGGAGEVASDGIGLEGAGGEARFFGVEARGSRFAFVVDVSGSMSEPGRIDALRAALLDSVDRMLESASFCIILYSSDAIPLMGPQWFRADEANKAAARLSIAQIAVSGATNPLPAFAIAFSLKPRPDAIYFMTDGIFPPEVGEQLPGTIDLTNRSGDSRVPIYCITFADRGSEQLMRRIARQSGGSYTHVEGPRR